MSELTEHERDALAILNGTMVFPTGVTRKITSIDASAGMNCDSRPFELTAWARSKGGGGSGKRVTGMVDENALLSLVKRGMLTATPGYAKDSNDCLIAHVEFEMVKGLKYKSSEKIHA